MILFSPMEQYSYKGVGGRLGGMNLGFCFALVDDAREYLGRAPMRDWKCVYTCVTVESFGDRDAWVQECIYRILLCSRFLG